MFLIGLLRAVIRLDFLLMQTVCMEAGLNTLM